MGVKNMIMKAEWAANSIASQKETRNQLLMAPRFSVSGLMVFTLVFFFSADNREYLCQNLLLSVFLLHPILPEIRNQKDHLGIPVPVPAFLMRMFLLSYC